MFVRTLVLCGMFACGGGSVTASERFERLVNGVLPEEVPAVKAVELRRLGKAEVVFLDARARKEYEVSHVPGAVWVGYQDFDRGRVTSIDKGQPIVVYCTVGYRSGKVAEQLRGLGYEDVSHLWGGIIAWVNGGNPVVNHSGETAMVHTYSEKWSPWLRVGQAVVK